MVIQTERDEWKHLLQSLPIFHWVGLLLGQSKTVHIVLSSRLSVITSLLFLLFYRLSRFHQEITNCTMCWRRGISSREGNINTKHLWFCQRHRWVGTVQWFIVKICLFVQNAVSSVSSCFWNANWAQVVLQTSKTTENDLFVSSLKLSEDVSFSRRRLQDF